MYMTKEEIINEFSKKSISESTPDPRNETVPAEEFFNFDDIKKHKDSYKPFLLEKSVTPSDVDLREFDSPVESQDNGKCSAWALSHAMGLMLNKRFPERKFDLSEWHVWSKYAQYSCAAAIAALSNKNNRVCDEIYWAQYGSKQSGAEENKHAWVSSQRYIGSDVEKMKQALSQGHVVYLGMTVPQDMSSGRAVIRADSPATKGGHALAIVGYYTDNRIPGGTVAILKNSWGTRTGDKGYQYLPIQAYAQRRDLYIAMWELADVESKRGIPAPKFECVGWKRPWYAPWKKVCTQWLEV